MNRIVVALAAGILAGTAVAKLPPPSPEEKVKLEKQQERKKAQTEQEKKSLDQAQERVARQYRAEHPGKGGPPPAQAEAEKLKKGDVPKAARHPEGAPAHPNEGREGKPQGQAHSN